MTGLDPGAATMTVLFTDLVDSTAMRSRLGDDRADAVRREHDDLLARHVADHRGVVVKGLGDGIMAVFLAPSEGLAGAIAIQQAILRRNRRAAVKLSLRMGMSVGEVRVEGDDVFGTPVVEAARLCSRAADDQILTSLWVKALAGSRSPAPFAEVGALQLKGLTGELITYEVRWREVGDASVVPFPDTALTDADGPLVGRSAERATLVDAWSRTRAGRAPVVVVRGRPGVGRTRLAVEFARSVHGDGATVLHGRCDPGGDAPFRPFAEALGQHLAHLSDSELSSRLGAGPLALVRLVPELDGRLPAANGSVGPHPARDTEPWELFEAVGAWLESTARGEPSVLLLDDLHWAGRSTLALLDHLVTHDRARQVLVIATSDADAGAGSGNHHLDDLLAEWKGGRRPIELLDLAPLDDRAAARVLDHHSEQRDAPLEGDIRDRLLRRAGGNPLYITHAHRHLTSDGAPGRSRDGRDDELPSTLPSLLAARVAACPAAAVAVARVGSVIGREFEVPVVEAVADLDRTVVSEALTDLAAAGLVDAGRSGADQRSFTHPEIPLAVYHGLTVGWRARCHRRVGAEIELRAGPTRSRHLDELAFHFVEAAAEGDRTQGIDHATAAARAATAKLAPYDAARWYRTAVRLLDVGPEPAPPERLLPLVLALGEAEATAGIRRARATLTRAGRLARDIDDTEALGRAVLALPPDPLQAPDPPEPDWDELLDEANRRVDLGTPMQAELVALQAWRDSGRDTAAAWDPDPFDTQRSTRPPTGGDHEPNGQPSVPPADGDAVAETAEKARRLARQVGDAHVVGRVLQLWMPAVEGRVSSDDRADTARELFEVSERVGHALWQARATVFVARAVLERGDTADSTRWLTRGRQLADQLDETSLHRALDALGLEIALLQGDLDRAERLIGGVTGGRSTSGPATDELHPGSLDPTDILVTESLIHRLQGRNLELAVPLDGAARADPAAGGYAVLRALADAGRQDQAARLYAAAAADGFPIRPVRLRAAALSNLAYLAALYGDEQDASRLIDRLLPFADRFARSPVPLHVGAHYQAMLAAVLGRNDEAHHLFEFATTRHEDAGAPLYAAETRLEWARFCLAVGRQDQARTLAATARRVAEHHHAGGLAAQAATVLEHLGDAAEPSRRPRRSTMRLPPPGLR